MGAAGIRGPSAPQTPVGMTQRKDSMREEILDAGKKGSIREEKTSFGVTHGADTILRLFRLTCSNRAEPASFLGTTVQGLPLPKEV